MTPVPRILKLSCLALVFFALCSSSSFLTTAYARSRQAKTRARGRSTSHSARGKSAGRRISTRRAEARRRRAEAARLARQRALDKAMRNQVQSMIAKDDTTGEDADVRRVAVEALGNHAGTVVVMNPQTGQVYSIVNQEWAVREGFKPCSTIKLVTGLAGLNEKVINPTDTVSIFDTNHIDLTKALAYSKNEYFQQVGGQVGFEKMVSYARRLGLGEKTGINSRNEFQGSLPVLKSGFALNRMSSHGDDFKVTAVQLATLVSAMANGGKLLAPFVARASQDEARKPTVRRQVNIDADTWHYMVPGMVGAVNYGSGRRAYDPAATVVGKTGTCIDNGTWVGLFTSYAPLADPRLAVVVIARGADAHSHFPAAVAGRIYRDLNNRLGASGSLQVTAASYSTESTASGDVVDDEESEEAAAENGISEGEKSTLTKAPRPLLRNQSALGNSKLLKRVLLTVPKLAEQPVPRAHPRPRRVFEQ